MTAETIPEGEPTGGGSAAEPAPALLTISMEGGRAATTGPTVFETSRAVQSERGRFATSSWHFDGTTLRAETSPRGLVALYYAALPKRFVIGTHIRSVIDALGAVTVDRPAMLLFHLLYQYVDGRTAFKEVKVLPLSARLTWDAASGVRMTRSPPIEPRPFAGSIEAAERRCDELIRAAVQTHRGSGDHVLALSGGRDSRHILLALRASGLGVDRVVTAHHYLAFSYADVAVARQVADRLGMKTEVKAPFPDRVAAEIGKNWLTGLQTMDHSWGLALADAVAGPRTVYDGMNGGSLLGRSRLAGIERKLFPGVTVPPAWRLRQGRIIDAIITEEAIRVLPGFLTRPKIVEAARALLADSFGRYSDFPSPAQAFRVLETGPREFPLLTLGMLRNDEVVCPFDDNAFAAFALGLPWHVSNDYGFHDRVLRAAYPEFADVPLEMNAPYPPGPPLFDRAAEGRSLRRALRVVGPKRAAALIPDLDRMLKQPALTHRQIQHAIYALQTKAVQLGRNLLMRLPPEELPPMPTAWQARARKEARRSGDPDL